MQINLLQVLQSTDIFDFLAEVIINQPDRNGQDRNMDEEEDGGGVENAIKKERVEPN